MTKRPKDGVFRKFTDVVMREICALVPDFADEKEAVKFYKRLLRLKRTQGYLDQRFPNGIPEKFTTLLYDPHQGHYNCGYQAAFGPILATDRHNPMEVLHLFAHIVQPVDSAMHKGEFGAIFTDLVERIYDAEMKRKVKDIMVNYNIRTWAKSPESRQKQVVAYQKRRVSKIVGKFTDDG